MGLLNAFDSPPCGVSERDLPLISLPFGCMANDLCLVDRLKVAIVCLTLAFIKIDSYVLRGCSFLLAIILVIVFLLIVTKLNIRNSDIKFVTCLK